MVTPGLIQTVWALGSAAIVLVPIVTLAVSDTRSDSLGPLVAVGVPLILLALFVWRLYCENLVVLFAVNECVKESGTLVRLAEGDTPVEASTRVIDFLTFRSMLAVPLIQVVWFLGALIVTAYFLYWGIAIIDAGDTNYGVLILALTPFALLAYRVLCEWAIVVFAMNTTIGSMRRAMPTPVVAPSEPLGREASAAAKKFAGGVDAAKRFVRIQKLRHDIKTIRASMVAQRVNLGSLALQHQAAMAGIEAEAAELSQVQSDLKEKRASLDSLQATDRSNPAVRELKRELTGLQRRQRELTLAVGTKVDAARAHVPGAIPVYSAIDQLRTSLEAKQTELGQLGASPDPATEDSGVPRQLPDVGAWKKPVAVGGAVLGVVLILWLLASMIGSLGGSGLPKWAGSCLGEDVRRISYVNLKKLREDEQYDDLARYAGVPALPFRVQPEELNEAVVIRTEDSAFNRDLVLFRTIEDLSLDDLAERRPCRREETDGTECLVVSAGFMGSLWLAKTGTRTYCYAGDRQSMQDALDRIAGRKPSELNDELKESLSQVAANDVCHVGFSNAYGAAFPGLEVYGFGLSADSSKWSFDGVFVFGETGQAEGYMEKREDQIEQIRARLASDRISKEEHDRIEQHLNTVERLEVSRRDRRVHCHGKWPVEEKEDARNLVLDGMAASLLR
jgi:hypothetical protein